MEKENRLEESEKIIFEDTNLFQDILFNYCTEEDLIDAYIWPKRRSGTDNRKNILKVCKITNNFKSERTKKIIINNIEFGVVLQKNIKGRKFGSIRIKYSTLNDSQREFYEKNNLIKKMELLNHMWFLTINSDQERFRCENYLKQIK